MTYCLTTGQNQPSQPNTYENRCTVREAQWEGGIEGMQEPGISGRGMELAYVSHTEQEASWEG